MDSLNLPFHLAQFADWEYAAPASGTALSITKCGSIPIATGASGETNTLPNPTRAGLWLNITMYSDGGGDRVITTELGVTQDGDNTMTFADAGDTIFLQSVRHSSTTFRWRMVAKDGVVLSLN